MNVKTNICNGEELFCLYSGGMPERYAEMLTHGDNSDHRTGSENGKSEGEKKEGKKMTLDDARKSKNHTTRRFAKEYEKTLNDAETEKRDHNKATNCVDCGRDVGKGVYMIKSVLDGLTRCRPLYQPTPSCSYIHMAEETQRVLNAWNDMLPIIGKNTLYKQHKIDALTNEVICLGDTCRSLTQANNDLNVLIDNSVAEMKRMEKKMKTSIDELKEVIEQKEGEIIDLEVQIKEKEGEIMNKTQSCAEMKTQIETMHSAHSAFVESTILANQKYNEEKIQFLECLKSTDLLVESIVEHDDICCVCTTCVSNVRYDYCNHLCICQECSLKLGDGNAKCPLCRTEGPRTQVKISWNKVVTDIKEKG